MEFLFKSSTKNRNIIIFDIGSDSVGGAFVSLPYDKEKIPHIIKSTRIEIDHIEDLSFELLLKEMSEALEETVNDLYQSKVGSPAEIYCVLASPWYFSEVRNLKMSREHPFVFNKNIIDDILNKEITSFIENNKKTDSNSELIERQVMNVLLNGYKVDDPMGKSCKSVEMNIVLSTATEICLNKIREILTKTYHHTKVNFSSFALDSFIAVRDKYVSPDSYLLIDVGGEVTDVNVVSKGLLKSSLSFPFGKRTILKYLCKKLDMEMRDAKELFNLYSTNAISEKLKNEITPIFTEIENIWSKSFHECINTLPHTITLPNTIFLTVDNDVKSWFLDLISNEEYVKSMFAEHKTQVVGLEGSEFLNMCDVSDGDCDPFLMIEAIAIARKLNK